jgi:hypothetical protein
MGEPFESHARAVDDVLTNGLREGHDGRAGRHREANAASSKRPASWIISSALRPQP